ncbi:pyrroline-5-carboxylate reductase family protein [Bombilactobacillus thymidiniphilus]|uniref:Pyrroline-5-carboxylate reductase n=1 Tax=Bombilactobacillus thymidiniphilus TaxID=2923363 RepID=A0ABY4PB41_9LACO|nr:pyrroline-5-carboxylate reductase dimerization domain-containing protein [Bombilactobacillus thymidiniphilus]UQS82983.1 NAD(P)-binding domain-containing protein [Bombilactobacillus thymidiniphilus]
MKIGLIGAGRIGSAVVKGLLKSGIVPTDILVKNSRHKTAEKLVDQYELTLVNDDQKFQDCAVVLIAIHGDAVLQVVHNLADVYHGIIVSFGGGDIEAINQQIAPASFVLATPNTAVEISQGIVPVSFAATESDTNKSIVEKLFERLGQVYVVNPELQGAYGTLAGCTPAYLAVMLDALSDAGALTGISRAQADKIIKQMVLGTAQLLQETDLSFGELKDYTATPGGSTIKGVVALEENNFRNAVIKAVQAANGK